MWFSLALFPTPQYFLHPSKKLLPAIVIRAHTSLLPDRTLWLFTIYKNFPGNPVQK